MKGRNTIFGAILCMLAGLAFLPRAQAVVPTPDGGYPGFNTAEGQNALLSLDVNNGFANTAVGWFSLLSNVDGDFNTATGAGSLLFNTESKIRRLARRRFYSTRPALRTQPLEPPPF